MTSEEIVIAPIITEQANMQMAEGKYTFKVAKKATKIDIKNAVEKLFEVKVLDVRTMTVKGKERKVNGHIGRTSDWKKAIVTIDLDPQTKTYVTKGGKEVKTDKKYKNSIEGFTV